MADKPNKDQLSAALRANLKRRKAAARKQAPASDTPAKTKTAPSDTQRYPSGSNADS